MPRNDGMKKKLALATLLATSLALAPIIALTAVAPASAATISSASTTLNPGASSLSRVAGSWTDGTATMTWDDLKGQLDSRRPEILLSVGTIGLLLLVWLMVIKPGG